MQRPGKRDLWDVLEDMLPRGLEEGRCCLAGGLRWLCVRLRKDKDYIVYDVNQVVLQIPVGACLAAFLPQQGTDGDEQL